MLYRVITAPTVEPINIAVLRQHLRLDTDPDTGTHEDDAIVLLYLSAAREAAEQFLGIALAPTTVEATVDSFPAGALELPGGSVASVTSVSYLDANQVRQTVAPADYFLDPYSTPSRLGPAVGKVWPSASSAIAVRYVTGEDALKPSIRAALLLMVAHMYENRSDVEATQTFAIPMGSRHLLQPFRVGMGV